MTTAETVHLAAAARAVYALQRTTLVIPLLIRRGDLSQAETFAEQASEAVNAVSDRLRAAGVSPEAFNGVPVPASRELTLDQLDTPDVRALLRGIEALVPLAERIDYARGRWYDGAPDTDTPGTDLAETLHLLACRLHVEAFGPNTGRD